MWRGGVGGPAFDAGEEKKKVEGNGSCRGEENGGEMGEEIEGGVAREM